MDRLLRLIPRRIAIEPKTPIKEILARVTPGGRTTLEAVRKIGKTGLRVEEEVTRPSHVVAWLREHNVRVVNVAGNRESKAPGIGDRVERFLGAVFRRLGHRPG